MKCWLVRIHLSMMAFEAARATLGCFMFLESRHQLLDYAPGAACELADHLLGVFDSDVLDELPEIRQLEPTPMLSTATSLLRAHAATLCPREMASASERMNAPFSASVYMV